MVKVQYVGSKPMKIDNIAGTGLVWNGNGDVQEVDEQVWAKLSQHPSVWVKAPEPAKEPRYAIVKGENEVIVLDDMSVEALRAFAEANDIRVDARLKDAEKIRQFIYSLATSAEA